MKKLSIAAVAFAALSFTACNHVPQADMNNSADSLSYMSGFQQGSYISQNLQRIGVDSSNVDQFIKGMLDGYKHAEDKNKQIYMEGMKFGVQCANGLMPYLNQNVYGADSTKTLSEENVMAGLIQGLQEKNPEMKRLQIDSIVSVLRTAVKEETFASNRKAGEEYMKANAQKEGVKTTQSGLQYKVIKQGNGAVPSENSKVKLSFTARLINGETVESFKADSIDFPVNRSFNEGFKEALTMMPVGSKWEVTIPQNLAFGDEAVGNIKPFSALIFDIELISIKAEDKK